MRLVGMLDSPFVRRVAIAFDCLGIPFVHEPVSVFTTFEAFQRINPVVKAPTLACDDGEVMMDSSLILQFVEMTRTGERAVRLRAQPAPPEAHSTRRGSPAWRDR